VGLLQAEREAFVIAGQALATDAPVQAALDDPSAGQQHEAAFGLAEFDYVQVDAVGFGRLGGYLTRVALAIVSEHNDLS
jgi:hypothetical protein